ncbi:MAG: hypothetical protein NTZ56_24655 [Acidobacteria bacterium]|nr:hypothetical protein [Acidobacteriota bacterium]
MKKRLACVALLSLSSLWSQRITDRRSAEIRGGGGEGKCTIEVEVDDVAEVEIIGPNAAIRTINGSPATFRRFQCNQAMPNRPAQFRFEGVDGRGRQDLVRSAEDGGRAVIRIEDSKGGREGYTFDIFWRGGSGYGGGGFERGGGFGRGGRGGYEGDSRGGYGDNNGWNDGWGNGNGWISNGNFNFQGGRRDSGSYRDRNGDRRRLDSARVFIDNSGAVTVAFESDQGRLEFAGRIERRQGRRVYAQVRGSGMFGPMEIEMSSRTTVGRITLSAVSLSWSN